MGGPSQKQNALPVILEHQIRLTPSSHDQDTWLNTHIPSTYKWKPARDHKIQGSTSSQAVEIKVVRRRDRTKGAARSKELYACKYYAVSKLGTQHKISAPKYIYREWQMLRRIEHPNILRYEDFAYGPEGGLKVAKLYTEYCPKGDLSQFEIGKAPKEKHLHPREVAQVFYQLAQALLYLQHGIHKFGPILEPAKAVRTVEHEPESPSDAWLAIIHRDIKPQNVFVSERCRNSITVKLGDFGIATHDSDGRTQTYVGTDLYFAPEQRSNNPGGARTTVKSDIYTLGLTMKQIFTPCKNIDHHGKAERPLSICLSTLIENCQQLIPVRRPTSIEILDQLKRYTEPRQPHWLLSDAFASLIRCNNLDDPNYQANGGEPHAQPDVLCAMLLKGYSDIDTSDPEAEDLLLEVCKFIEQQEEVAMVGRTMTVSPSVPRSHLDIAKRIKSLLRRASKKGQRRLEHEKPLRHRKSRPAFSIASQLTCDPCVAGPSRAPRALLDVSPQSFPQVQAFGLTTPGHNIVHDSNDHEDKHSTLDRFGRPPSESKHGRIQIISTSSLVLALLSLFPSPSRIANYPNEPLSYIPSGRHRWSASTRVPLTTPLEFRLVMVTAFVFVAFVARYWRHPIPCIKEDIAALCDQLQIGGKHQNRNVILRSGQDSTDSPWCVTNSGCERGVHRSVKWKHSMARTRICIGFSEALFSLKRRSTSDDIEMDMIHIRI